MKETHYPELDQKLETAMKRLALVSTVVSSIVSIVFGAILFYVNAEQKFLYEIIVFSWLSFLIVSIRISPFICKKIWKT